MTLPIWRECEIKHNEGIANPIEEFIYVHEPVGSPKWRHELEQALEWSAQTCQSI